MEDKITRPNFFIGYIFKFYENFCFDNPTRKFLTNRIAAFFKFEPIKLIYSEKIPSRVKKQPAE
jgi:hypothetical protein